MTTTRLPESSNRQLERLSDQALLNEFGELVRRDHHHLARLLRHIDLIDRRKLWARQGYSSLFAFLVGRYHMSESTAGKRIGAARLACRFPIVFTMVARGELHLSGIHCIQAHLTPENHERVLADAKHKTMRQLEELVARLAPKPDVPTTLRKLPNRPGADAAITTPAPAPTVPATTGEASQPPAPAPIPPRPVPHPTPLAPGRYKLQVTINQSTRDKLEQLQDLLAHQLPKGDVAAILERAFDVLLVQIHKRKTGITAKPRARQPQAEPQAAEPQAAEPQAVEPQAVEPQAVEPQAVEPQAVESAPAGERTRYLEVSVRREVWPRDDGRCGFVGDDGCRCNATRGLQFAHKKPWAKGGADTADSIGLRCPAHNALEADRDYGASFMAHKRKQKSLKVRAPLARYLLRDTKRVAVERGEGSTRWVGSHELAHTRSAPLAPHRQWVAVRLNSELCWMTSPTSSQQDTCEKNSVLAGVVPVAALR